VAAQAAGESALDRKPEETKAMRLAAARVQNYRSIRDTGWFDIEDAKTILVGPNEAGKTAVLQALQQINPPEGAPRFEALRDYPRSAYNDITTGQVDPAIVDVVSVKFVIEPEDLNGLPMSYEGARYCYTRRLDNGAVHSIENGPEQPRYDVALAKKTNPTGSSR
jgi:hypothetical protein